MLLLLGTIGGERVRTTKIRMSKSQKNIKNVSKHQNIESLFFSTSKVRTIRTSKVRKIRTAKVVDQNVENQYVKKNIESQKSIENTFDILIIQNAIDNIRTSIVLVHFLHKNLFDALILSMVPEKIRTCVQPMVTKACGELG
jgi:hypothetical protein